MTTTAYRHPSTYLRVALPLVVVLTLLLLLPYAGAQAPQERPTGISVTGSGVAYGEPDQAILTLGVTAVGANVREALAQADAVMESVRKVALEHGLSKRDIRTASFNVWREELRDSDSNVTGERYHVTHSYQLTVSDTAQVGELLAAAVDAGANDVGGITYSIADAEELRREARASAMADAHQRAQQLAELAFVALGPPTAIVEMTSGPGPSGLAQYSMRADAAMSSPVESGELAVRVEVAVTYEFHAGR